MTSSWAAMTNNLSQLYSRKKYSFFCNDSHESNFGEKKPASVFDLDNQLQKEKKKPHFFSYPMWSTLSSSWTASWPCAGPTTSPAWTWTSCSPRTSWWTCWTSGASWCPSWLFFCDRKKKKKHGFFSLSFFLSFFPSLSLSLSLSFFLSFLLFLSFSLSYFCIKVTVFCPFLNWNFALKAAADRFSECVCCRRLSSSPNLEKKERKRKKERKKERTKSCFIFSLASCWRSHQ